MAWTRGQLESMSKYERIEEVVSLQLLKITLTQDYQSWFNVSTTLVQNMKGSILIFLIRDDATNYY